MPEMLSVAVPGFDTVIVCEELVVLMTWFDRFNYVVRKVSTTGVITTVAGSPGLSSYTGDGGLARNATINFSSGLTLDAAGNIYIADAQNNVVRRVDATSGIITTVAGNHFATVLNNNSGIPATAVTLNYPENVAIDAYGSLVIADRNWLIREVDPNGALDFGNQAINTTSTVKTVTVSNIGNTPLHFNSTTPYATSGDFAFVSGGTCDFTQPLAAGASCNVRVSFTPAAAYERYGTLAFYNDGVASPQMTQLRGNGTLPIASQAVLSPSTLNFSDEVDVSGSIEADALRSVQACVDGWTIVAGKAAHAIVVRAGYGR
jgi:hypothetical protein